MTFVLSSKGNFLCAIKLLSPNQKTEQAELTINSNFRKSIVESWLHELFYNKIQGYFFANDFKRANKLLNLLPLKHFEPIKQKDLRSYKRWSNIRKWIQ
jgi:hypothetical protein